MYGWPREAYLSGKLLLAQAAIGVEDAHNVSINLVQERFPFALLASLLLLSVK
jgi:hypothetical protein